MILFARRDRGDVQSDVDKRGQMRQTMLEMDKPQISHWAIRRGLALGMTLAWSCCIRAQTPAAAGAPESGLSPIVVTATRSPESSLDLPVSIDRVDQREIQQGQPEENMSESLAGVPGASIETRQNYAQDLQISIRGFGARSSFGTRGVRLYSDGIPGTMPDGQGQFSQFDLGSADHIEVLRGPFSALYGNASGGVISVFSEDGPPGSEIGATAVVGPFDTHRYSLKAGGTASDLNYMLDAAHFDTDGYRDHSSAERNHFNSKVRLELENHARITLIANVVESPYIQDPLGLTAAQLGADPRQAGTNALLYNTRKNLSQEQAGIIYEQTLFAGLDLSATLYGGHRATTQFQAILKSVELTPTSPGGIIDLGHVYGGTDVHVSDQLLLAGTPLKLTAGLSYDDLDETRYGYLNYIGTALGVEGALRRDQTNHAFNTDEYVQAQWDPAAQWRVLTGLRHSLVDVASEDHLAAPSVEPLTAVHYEATNPVAGVTYRANPNVSLYAAYGRGFETPTLNDLAYRSVNGNPPGLNIGLRPAHSDNYEAGIKSAGSHLAFDLTGFYIDTHDELAVQQSSGGRSVYQNIPETERRGAEAGMSATLPAEFSARVAYTWLRAEVAQPYSTCITSPCIDHTVAVGSRLPAVPENSLYMALSWRPQKWGFSTTLEAVGRAQIYANDLDTAAADGYWVENLKVGFEQAMQGWNLSEFARIDNILNRSYVDSVILNDTNMRYFEPEPGRVFYLMLAATVH
jgi:iron complex outermembrane recepter protein